MAESKAVIQVQEHRLGRTSELLPPLRSLALPAMAGLLGLYVALHSPLRDLIASVFGMKSRGCFFCAESFSLNQTGDSLAAFAVIAMAVIAAWIAADYFDGTSYE